MAELELAEKAFRQAEPREDLTAMLGFIASTAAAFGDSKKSRSLFDELAKLSKEERKDSNFDYPFELEELAGASILVLDSFSVAAGIMEETLFQLKLQKRETDPLVLKSMISLGMIQLKSGRGSAAVSILHEAKALAAANAGAADACRVDDLLAQALLVEKKYSEVESLCKARIEIERKGKFKNADFPSVITSLADVYQKMGKKSQAAALIEQWKKEFKSQGSNLQYMTFLRECADRLHEDAQASDMGNEASSLYETIEANKWAVNTFITHYYVLKEIGLTQRAKISYDLETRLRRMENRSALPRELTGLKPESGTDATELNAEQKQKLERDNYEVKRALDAYRKFVEGSGDKRKLAELDEIISIYQRDCS